MRRRLSHISCWLLAATAVACTEEDLSVCEPGIRLQYRYEQNHERANLFGPEVGRVEAYVFDSNGLFEGVYTDQGGHLTNDYVMSIPLPRGEYSVLVWGHGQQHDVACYDQGYQYDAQTRTFGKELQAGVTSIEQIRLMLQHDSRIPEPRTGTTDEEPGFLIDERPDPLFYGLVTRVTSRVNPPAHQVELMKNTKLIHIVIEGLNAYQNDPNAELPEIYATAQDGLYDYYNQIPDEARRLMYTPHAQTREGDRMDAQITVMRLMTAANAAGPTILSVTDPVTGTVFFEGDVVEALMKVKDSGGNYPYQTQGDLDRQDEFTFRIRVDANMDVTVWINEWEIKNITPEL